MWNRMFNRGLNCLHKFILYHILSSPAQVEGYGGDRHPLSSLSVSSYTIAKKQLIMKPHCCADCLSNACTYSRLLWASFGPSKHKLFVTTAARSLQRQAACSGPFPLEGINNKACLHVQSCAAPLWRHKCLWFELARNVAVSKETREGCCGPVITVSVCFWRRYEIIHRRQGIPHAEGNVNKGL